MPVSPLCLLLIHRHIMMSASPVARAVRRVRHLLSPGIYGRRSICVQPLILILMDGGGNVPF